MRGESYICAMAFELRGRGNIAGGVYQACDGCGIMGDAGCVVVEGGCYGEEEARGMGVGDRVGVLGVLSGI